MARMNRPAPVEVTYKNMRFLITHNPSNATLGSFIEVSGLAGVQRAWLRCPQPPEDFVAVTPALGGKNVTPAADP